MKKSFLRYFAGLMATCMLVLSGGAMGAETNTEIIIIDDIDEQKAQLIINTIIGDDGEVKIGISPASIFCIFGHDMSESIVWEIMHRYYSTAPKCHQNTYKVVYCKRSSCNYMVYTLMGKVAIHCCS